MAAGFQITADLPGQQYTFRQDIVPTDLRPDIVMWNTSAIFLVELTVPFETNIAGAAERKVHRYRELANMSTFLDCTYVCMTLVCFVFLPVFSAGD